MGALIVTPEQSPQTPYEKFVEVTKRVLSISKRELEKREKAWRRKRARDQEKEKRV